MSRNFFPLNNNKNVSNIKIENVIKNIESTNPIGMGTRAYRGIGKLFSTASASSQNSIEDLINKCFAGKYTPNKKRIIHHIVNMILTKQKIETSGDITMNSIINMLIGKFNTTSDKTSRYDLNIISSLIYIIDIAKYFIFFLFWR